MDAISLAMRARFWKSHLLLPETPRKGDLAAIVKDHHKTETGALVKVRDDPVFARIFCIDCGQEVPCYAVEIQVCDDLGRAPPPGENVFAYPVQWLQRVLPLAHADASRRLVSVR